MRYHLVVAFCTIILAVYSTGCYDKCLKNAEHQKLFYGTIYGGLYCVNKKYIVQFSSDFKYKVSSFITLSIYILQTIMLKGLLGSVYHELKTLKTINKVH